MTAQIIDFPAIKRGRPPQVADVSAAETILLNIDSSGRGYGLNGQYGYRAAAEYFAVAMNSDPPVPA
jgi:hypothetical protein